MAVKLTDGGRALGVYVEKSLIEKARAYAAEAHRGQLRKYTHEPYLNHVAEVASIVADVGGSAEMVAAAFLHDTIEDCGVTSALLEIQFGKEVADLVDQLTDRSKLVDGNRAVRKQIDLTHIREASPAAKTIKLADLISNSLSIIEHDPKFAMTYMAEKRDLLSVLTEGDPRLFLRASRIVDAYFAR